MLVESSFTCVTPPSVTWRTALSRGPATVVSGVSAACQRRREGMAAAWALLIRLWPDRLALPLRCCEAMYGE